jgi:pantetheine-phosphate adenylyltransferase
LEKQRVKGEMRRFKCVAVGGTFDRLHEGHKALLRKACDTGETVIIGVATGKLLENKVKKELIYPYEHRVNDIKEFLASIGCIDRALLVPIFSQFGTTTEDAKIEALVVSEETAPIIKDINQERVKRGLQPLHKVLVKMVLGTNGKPIKSTTIRQIEAHKRPGENMS